MSRKVPSVELIMSKLFSLSFIATTVLESRRSNYGGHPVQCLSSRTRRNYLWTMLWTVWSKQRRSVQFPVHLAGVTLLQMWLLWDH